MHDSVHVGNLQHRPDLQGPGLFHGITADYAALIQAEAVGDFGNRVALDDDVGEKGENVPGGRLVLQQLGNLLASGAQHRHKLRLSDPEPAVSPVPMGHETDRDENHDCDGGVDRFREQRKFTEANECPHDRIFHCFLATG